jgi:hypothetical protein
MAGSAGIFREQDVARTKRESSVLRFELQDTAQGNHKLPRGIRMPSELWIQIRFVERGRVDRELCAERVSPRPGLELDETFLEMRLAVRTGP